MEMDIDMLIQLMEMMNVSARNTNSPEQRRQRMIFAMLKLMETRRLLESYEAQYGEGSDEDGHMHMLLALRPHMTGERRHMMDIIIKMFEIRQIMNRMGAGAYGC